MSLIPIAQRANDSEGEENSDFGNIIPVELRSKPDKVRNSKTEERFDTEGVTPIGL